MDIEYQGENGGLFTDMIFDETDPEAAKRIRAFLDEYKMLCRKYGCCVVADGEDVEVVPSEADANLDDPWDVEATTRERGWKI